jgi:hypothetical protein
MRLVIGMLQGRNGRLELDRDAPGTRFVAHMAVPAAKPAPDTGAG